MNRRNERKRAYIARTNTHRSLAWSSRMLLKLKSGVAAAAVVLSPLAVSVVVAAPAHAAKDYANCDALHRDFKYGVARSKAAARKQANTGHYRPAVRAALYRANDESDADNDGTACEVTR